MLSKAHRIIFATLNQMGLYGWHNTGQIYKMYKRRYSLY